MRNAMFIVVLVAFCLVVSYLVTPEPLYLEDHIISMEDDSFPREFTGITIDCERLCPCEED